MFKEFAVASTIIGLILALAAQAAKAESFQYQGKEITKLEAMKILIQDSGAEVQRCQKIEMTDKGTIRNVKLKKSDIVK